MTNITQILAAWREGKPDALAELIPLVYDELYRQARMYMAGERQGHLLQPTALVHEAFVRLLEWQPEEWKNRAHFFGVSATLMRRILVQFAREQLTAKRGGGAYQVSLVNASGVPVSEQSPEDVDLLALDEAMRELETLDSRQARIVEIRFFGGLTSEETAEALDISLSTVRREWRIARAWLQQRLQTKPV